MRIRWSKESQWVAPTVAVEGEKWFQDTSPNTCSAMPRPCAITKIKIEKKRGLRIERKRSLFIGLFFFFWIWIWIWIWALSHFIKSNRDVQPPTCPSSCKLELKVRICSFNSNFTWLRSCGNGWKDLQRQNILIQASPSLYTYKSWGSPFKNNLARCLAPSSS